MDFVESGPAFACDEQMAGVGEVGDAVEDVLGPAGARVEICQVNRAGDATGPGVDDNDPVRGPDVGVDRAVDEFELVQAVHGPTSIPDLDLPGLAVRVRVEKVQCGCAVAVDQLPAVVRDPPALRRVGELFEQGEPVLRIDEARVGSPCELDELVTEDRDSFAEVLARQAEPLDDLSRLQLPADYGRLAVEPRPLVEEAVLVHEPLRERPAVVRIAVDHLILGKSRVGFGRNVFGLRPRHICGPFRSHRHACYKDGHQAQRKQRHRRD